MKVCIKGLTVIVLLVVDVVGTCTPLSVRLAKDQRALRHKAAAQPALAASTFAVQPESMRCAVELQPSMSQNHCSSCTDMSAAVQAGTEC